MFVENLGDSRKNLSKGGQTVQMSRDPEPNRSDEAEMICERGGLIINGQIMGDLTVSRAFGDLDFKVHDPILREIVKDDGQEEIAACWFIGPHVSSTLELGSFPIDPTQDEAVVFGSHGLYNIFTNQEFVDFTLETRLRMDLQ